jgi:hypothetical protein
MIDTIIIALLSFAAGGCFGIVIALEFWGE